MPPLVFMALRFTAGGLILAAFCTGALRQLTGVQWRAALLVGVIFGVAMIFWVLGLKLTKHVGVGAFLSCLGVVMVPFLSLLFGDRPGRYVYAALPFAVVGLACLSLDGEFHLGVAEVCFLLSALILGFMFIVASKAATHIGAMPLTSIQLLLTGLITGAAALGFESWDLQQPPAIWGWFLASLLIATCLRFVVMTHALGLTPPSHSAIIMTLEPVWTALLAVVWLGERMSQLQLLGCGLIFAAMLVNRWPALRQWLRQR